MEFAERLKNVKPSATFKYAALVKKPGVINLTIGRPDFDTPNAIKDATKKALDDGKVHYTPSMGIPELRAEIVKKLDRENGVGELDTSNVIVTGGAKSALFEVILAIINKNDVVALPDPSWISYEGMINFAEGKIDCLPLKPENGFIPDEDFFSVLENSKAKLLIINSPNNPTGAVYPEDTLKRIVEICEKKDVWLISDEPYETFIYEGTHFSPGSIYDKTITVNAFSKTFSMTGWRLGYAACKYNEVIEKMNLIQQQSLSCCTSFAQYGVLAAFKKESKHEAENMVREFKKRRDYVMERVERLKVVCKKPAGAFYVFPYFKIDDLKFAEELLDNDVGVIPGSPFGSKGEGCLRISYGSASLDDLKKAFDVIETIA